MGARFELVLFSPKVRAAQTAKLAAEGWSGRARSVMAEHAPLAGGFDARQALEASAAVGEDGHLLLIGHEPDLSRIVGEITGGRIDMKKGGVAAVRLEAGGGELAALLRPRDLALLAGIPVRGH
jgi:phosphohistidine phosphatase